MLLHSTAVYADPTARFQVISGPVAAPQQRMLRLRATPHDSEPGGLPDLHCMKLSFTEPCRFNRRTRSEK
jgi:hypothetical protein